MAITSNLKSKKHTIILENKDLEIGNLKVTSCIRVDKIYTLSKEIIIKKFGTVKKEVLLNVKSEIMKMLEIK